MALIGGHWDEDEDFENSLWEDGNLMPTGMGSELREERREKRKRDKHRMDEGSLMPTGLGRDD